MDASDKAKALGMESPLSKLLQDDKRGLGERRSSHLRGSLPLANAHLQSALSAHPDKTCRTPPYITPRLSSNSEELRSLRTLEPARAWHSCSLKITERLNPFHSQVTTVGLQVGR